MPSPSTRINARPPGLRAGLAGADVVYVLPDVSGGVHTMCHNLLANRRPGGLTHGAVLTRNCWQTDPPSREPLPADWTRVVDNRLPAENLYAALRRLRRAVTGRGALVANDLLELAMVAAFGSERAVFSIVHGDFDYYYDLAVRHDADVDVYVAPSETIRRRLVERLPHRETDIVFLRHGVRIGELRQPQAGPLRLLFSGRIENRLKGTGDLPVIARHLVEMGANVTWTIQGDGPDLAGVRAAWPDNRATFTGGRPLAAAVAELPRHDLLVMPSRTEGFPLALIEAGAAGLVPVVSDLPSGVPEVVRHGENGWRLPVGDTRAFAQAIATLARDRTRLEQMSAAIRATVSEDWDIARNAAAYQRLFEDWRLRGRVRGTRRKVPYGSRLDQRWLPNPLVKAVRHFTWNPPVAS